MTHLSFSLLTVLLLLCAFSAHAEKKVKDLSDGEVMQLNADAFVLMHKDQDNLAAHRVAGTVSSAIDSFVDKWYHADIRVREDWARVDTEYLPQDSIVNRAIWIVIHKTVIFSPFLGISSTKLVASPSYRKILNGTQCGGRCIVRVGGPAVYGFTAGMTNVSGTRYSDIYVAFISSCKDAGVSFENCPVSRVKTLALRSDQLASSIIDGGIVKYTSPRKSEDDILDLESTVFTQLP